MMYYSIYIRTYLQMQLKRPQITSKNREKRNEKYRKEREK
jgi:hypothetical protein